MSAWIGVLLQTFDPEWGRGGLDLRFATNMLSRCYRRLYFQVSYLLHTRAMKRLYHAGA